MHTDTHTSFGATHAKASHNSLLFAWKFSINPAALTATVSSVHSHNINFDWNSNANSNSNSVSDSTFDSVAISALTSTQILSANLLEMFDEPL